METKQQRIERLRRELAEAEAMPDGRGMCFVPAVGEGFVCTRFDAEGLGWVKHKVERAIADVGSYTIPCLRPEYAQNFVKAMNQIFQFKGADGCVPADELVGGVDYWALNYDGEPDDWTHCTGTASISRYLIGCFTSEALLIAARDRICGSAEGAVEMMRNFHGVKGE